MSIFRTAELPYERDQGVFWKISIQKSRTAEMLMRDFLFLIIIRFRALNVNKNKLGTVQYAGDQNLFAA